MNAFIVFIASLFLCLSSFSISAQDYLFKNANLLTMQSEEVLSNKDVLIKKGKIIAIRDSGAFKSSANLKVIDASGKYLMPGLAEMHAHVPGNNSIETRDHYLYLYLINGVTTIRGMLGQSAHLKLREDLASNKVIGPRLITSGPSFNGNSVSSPDQARKKVQQQVKAGYDFLKLHPGLSEEEFIAIADQANKLNIDFAGHVSDDVGATLALAKEQATIDHLDSFFQPIIADEHQKQGEKAPGFFGINFVPYVDPDKIDIFAKQVAKSASWVVATETLMDNLFNPLSPDTLASRPEMKYVSASLVNRWKAAKKSVTAPAEIRKNFLKYRADLLTAIQKHNGKILLGSDAPQIFNVPGFSIHRELVLMVKNGLTPYQALRSGTVNAARYFNQEKEYGTLEVGKRAQLILLAKNPLKKIEHSSSIEGVMHNGLWINKPQIDLYLQNYLEK